MRKITTLQHFQERVKEFVKPMRGDTFSFAGAIAFLKTTLNACIFLLAGRWDPLGVDLRPELNS